MNVGGQDQCARCGEIQIPGGQERHAAYCPLYVAPVSNEGEGREDEGRCVEHGNWSMGEPYGQCPQCGDLLIPLDRDKYDWNPEKQRYVRKPAPAPVSGGDRARIEQRGAERVFAALSVHFAGHPDFDAVLAEFDGKGWTKEGAADLVPADDEVTVKREALALFVGFYFDGKGLDVHRAVKLGDITRAGESLRAALDERKEA